MSEQDEYREAMRYREWEQEQAAYEEAREQDEIERLRARVDTNELIERLRERARWEAADKIAALQKRVDELEAELDVRKIKF